MYRALPKIGLLGGGQLGRMLLQAAIDLDFEIACLDPDAEAPCYSLAYSFVHGSFQDFDTVMAFGQDQDVISIEIEHVNIEALEALEKQGFKISDIQENKMYDTGFCVTIESNPKMRFQDGLHYLSLTSDYFQIYKGDILEEF